MMNEQTIHVRFHLGWHLAALFFGFFCVFYAIKCFKTGEGPFQYIMVRRSKNPILFWSGLVSFTLMAVFFIGFGFQGIALFMTGK